MLDIEANVLDVDYIFVPLCSLLCIRDNGNYIFVMQVTYSNCSYEGYNKFRVLPHSMDTTLQLLRWSLLAIFHTSSYGNKAITCGALNVLIFMLIYGKFTIKCSHSLIIVAFPCGCVCLLWCHSWAIFRMDVNNFSCSTATCHEVIGVHKKNVERILMKIVVKITTKWLPGESCWSDSMSQLLRFRRRSLSYTPGAFYLNDLWGNRDV